jgi:hypothetical protein
MEVSDGMVWEVEEVAYKNPKLKLPAMVNFSRRGRLSFQMKIQGRIAKYKSTAIVPTDIY